MRIAFLGVPAALALLAASPALAQAPAPRVGFDASAAVRLRYEKWSWFEPAAPGFTHSYGYGAVRANLVLDYRARRWFDARVDVQNTSLLGLPDDAAAPPPAGDLGLGPTYFAPHQETSISRFFLNQGYVTLRSRNEQYWLRAGRMEYLDGLEKMTGDPTVDWLKRTRLSARTIGTFAFSHVGRSFDGIQVAANPSPRVNATGLLMRPRQGGFEPEGMKQIDEITMGAATLTFPNLVAPRSDLRLFFMTYHDGRDPADTVVKVDNRPGPARAADSAGIDLAFFGGHYAKAVKVGGGDADFLVWGMVQTGDWGLLKHRAWAIAVEGGVQPRLPWRPWLRAGFYQGSGDDDPADDTHRTYFPAVTTVRQYAQFPFYNSMNSRDVFAQLLLRPVPGKLVLKTELHRLDLVESTDLWYAGSGAFKKRGNFGYGGRPSNGNTSLATLLDLTVVWDPSPRYGVQLYGGHAFGSDVIRAIYPDDSADFAYAELTIRF